MQFSRLLILPLLILSIDRCAPSEDDDSPPPTATPTPDEVDAQAIASLEALIAADTNDGVLSFDDSNQIAQASLSPLEGLTRDELQGAEHLFENPPPVVEEVDGVDAAAGGQALIQVIYWGMPRDLSGSGDSGQSFTGGLVMDAHQYFFSDRPPYPLTLTVAGTAVHDYTLVFSVSEAVISLSIPAGSSSEETARLIAEALNSASDEIAQSSSDPDALQFLNSDTYTIGIDAQTAGAVIQIHPELDA